MTLGRFSIIGIVLFVSGLSLIQGQATSNATCGTSYQWMTNSKSQNPCLVSAYLSAECNSGQWGVPALEGTTLGPYRHPSGDSANLCRCNTVVYNLLQACSVCQSGNVGGWADWISNCTQQVTVVGTYPLPLPQGVAVPSWAYIDFTNQDRFIPSVAQQYATASGVPESMSSPAQTQVSTSATRAGPTSSRVDYSSNSGSRSGTSSGSISTNRPTAISNPQSTSSAGSSSNTGAIVGGVIGGVLALALVTLIAFLFARKKPKGPTKLAPREKFTYPGEPGYEPPPLESGYPVHQPYSAGHYTPVPVSQPDGDEQRHVGYAQQYGPPNAMGNSYRPYDPNDPSTFPTTPGPGNSSTVNSQGPTNHTHQTRPGQYTYAPEV